MQTATEILGKFNKIVCFTKLKLSTKLQNRELNSWAEILFWCLKLVPCRVDSPNHIYGTV